jgi:hypothetical protein
MKANFLNKITVGRGGTSSGKMATSLRKGETKQIEAAWKGELRISGFHEFCASEDVKEQMPELLSIQEEERRADAVKNGVDYLPERQVNAHHAIKSSLWNALSKEEKNEWTEIALNSNEEHHLSKDRCDFVSLYADVNIYVILLDQLPY